ncbi:MAG: hypothetical protein HY400_00240 [Elusimicrobia bacterium]|nr:hypothetical protein [Elusimicrobiota bacterium]
MDKKIGKAFLLLLLTQAVSAAINGPAISNNDYHLDLSVGPVLGSNRMVALGGAYVAIAEDVAGLPANPASVLYYHKEGDPRWRPSFTLGFFKAINKDLDNNGSTTSDVQSHQVVDFGMILQQGKWGAGILIVGQPMEVKTGDRITGFSFVTPTIALGRTFMDRQLNVALAIKNATLEIKDKASGDNLFKSGGSGAEIGCLWNSGRGPLRLGFTYQGRSKQDQDLDLTSSTPTRVAGLIVPREVELPWKISLGTSYVWPSVLNGRKFLLSFQGTFIGESRNAYGVDSFLEQKIQPVGTKTVFSPRMGGELELIPKKIRGRLGSYFEPSRFEGISGRTHVTGGFEWGFSDCWMEPGSSLSLLYAFDISKGYANHSISLGIWRF